jgi:hypothetical protein
MFQPTNYKAQKLQLLKNPRESTVSRWELECGLYSRTWTKMGAERDMAKGESNDEIEEGRKKEGVVGERGGGALSTWGVN